MVNMLLIVFFMINVILVAVLVWMFLEQTKLKEDYAQLRNSLERNNNDIAGICSAAVSVDCRLSENDEQLRGMMEQKIEVEHNDQPLNQGYDNAIQRIHHGANVEELVQYCGLSRDEAELLIRLHG